MRAYPFKGASGKSYTYMLLDTKNVNGIPRQGGNVIFARLLGGNPEIVFCFESRSIYGALINTTYWNTAQLDYHADGFFIHPQADESVRQAEVRDLVEGHDPPMNRNSIGGE